jgi:hypothetical protein
VRYRLFVDPRLKFLRAIQYGALQTWFNGVQFCAVTHRDLEVGVEPIDELLEDPMTHRARAKNDVWLDVSLVFDERQIHRI